VRLSDADRERLFDVLSAHAAAGRLDVPELERRVAAVAQAQTTEEAEAVLADLPPVPLAGSPGAAAGQRPRWGHGHGEADRPEPGWQPTPERFRDPKTGRIMRVWVDTGGGRHYVVDG
jgi:DUF1707 SHOCT-like domain